MPLPIQDLYSYETSQELYDFFRPGNLLQYIKQASGISDTDTTQDQRIAAQIAQVVVPLNLGTTRSVSPAFLSGTSIRPNDNVYPAATVNTTIWGFKIGVPPVGATPSPLPRVVLAAGVHAREIAPPLAVARYVRELIVTYIRNILLFDYKGVNIIHPAFKYQAGEREVIQEVPIPGGNGKHEGKRREDMSDYNLSPTKNHFAYILEKEFSYTDVMTIMTGLELILLPVVNPDGRDFVLTRADPGETSPEVMARMMWRKNRKPLLPHTGFAGKTITVKKVPGLTNFSMRPIGVDVDRNSDIAWDPDVYYEPTAASLNSGTHDINAFEDFIGPTSDTEEETLAVHLALTRSFNTADAQTGDYTGSLFFLNVHSASMGIYIPWGMEMNGRTSREYSHLNQAYDGMRDGVYKLPADYLYKANEVDPGFTDQQAGYQRQLKDKHKPYDEYQEFFPGRVVFGKAAETKNEFVHELYKTHRNTFAKAMADAIARAVYENTRVTKDSSGKSNMENNRMRHRSQYTTSQGLELYTTTGALCDWAFNLNLTGIVNITNYDATIHLDPNKYNPARQGPVISLCIEVGSAEDGQFIPIDAQCGHEKGTPDEYWTQNQYTKVERETFAAVHCFLMTSCTYTGKVYTGPAPK